MPSNVPSRRCRIIDPDAAVDEIRAFLKQIASEGERAWCEVWYPAPTHLDTAERAAWDQRQHDSFDAVELVDGELVTLPPYAELEGGA